MLYLKPDWPAPQHIKAYTTVRNSWGGSKSDEENQRLQTLLNLPDQPVWINQIHSNIVLEASPANKNKDGDACFTTHTNQVCAILTADCLPVLITNKQGTSAAAIHAGWRGLSAGIIEKTIRCLDQNNQDLLVWLGPAIGPQKFEVGKDVYDAFVNHHSESKTAFKPHAEGKWLANLYELAKIRLRLLDVSEIYGGDYCTFSQDELFFSYRRDHGKTGRMVSLIWIER